MHAADLEEAAALLRSGEYAQCAALTGQAIDRGQYGENWRLLKMQAELAMGDYDAALSTFSTALNRHYSSIRLRWLASRVYQAAGMTQSADRMLAEIGALVERSPWNYGDAENRVTLGKYFLEQGADARKVLSLFYDRAKQSDPESTEAFIAAGQLALDKHDYLLASKEFEQALKLDEENADIQLGLARAFDSSDSERSTQHLRQALTLNSKHTPSLLFAAEEQIDGEEYDAAVGLLNRALTVNPELSDAWALLAVIAHLKGQHDQEALYRRVALGWSPLEPRVDWLIGRKLSQHYRFQDGALHQRRALKMNPKYLAAKFQLAQDLLRLGQEDEGWQLAADVFAEDGYNVVAHNLVQLESHIEQFRTLQSTNLLLRMDATEAEIYGPRALKLLERARNTLCAKYKYQPPEPVLVELFPAQQDFAIRTFGLPGGEGFLGVCFGRVVTANSAAAQGGSPSNWESVLWHEYCHAITLGKTQNRMPRWLSEGLSVYEETLADPAWGQHMNAENRHMILGGDLTPLSQLSTAFLKPKTPQHLQFAYFEAAMVIEFLVERYSFDAILRTLDDIGQGLLLEDALPRHTGPLEQLDEQFAEYARQKAEAFAPGVDWSQPDLSSRANIADAASWIADHPDSYFAQQFQAEQLMAAEKWEEARVLLEKLVASCPENSGAHSPYPQLALACQKMGDTQREQAVLQEWVRRDGDALDALQRLADLTASQQSWTDLRNYADRALAIHPLLPAMHRHMATAAAELGDIEAGIASHQALLALDPIDPADAHFRLAELLLKRNDNERGDQDAAKRHVLQALEEAPRFRAAHQLLLRLQSPMTNAAPQEVGP